MSRFRRLSQRAFTIGVVCMRAVISQLAFGVSAVVEDAQGRVLLVRPRFGGGWGLPGGGVHAGEPAGQAILRELREEVGLSESAEPELLGLYTRRVAWATNLIALYRVRQPRIAFKPNFEILEVQWADPDRLPRNLQRGTARRLAELAGQVPRRHTW